MTVAQQRDGRRNARRAKNGRAVGIVMFFDIVKVSCWAFFEG